LTANPPLGQSLEVLYLRLESGLPKLTIVGGSGAPSAVTACGCVRCDSGRNSWPNQRGAERDDHQQVPQHLPSHPMSVSIQE
jgi:hypothetical protein